MIVLTNITENYKKAKLSDLSLTVPKDKTSVATSGYQPGGPFNDNGQSAASGCHGFDNITP